MSDSELTVTAVYADGGVVSRNPSPIGGTWAWCHVNRLGEVVRTGSGTITPAEAGLPWVSNNLTEVLALLHGLEAVPAKWAGGVYSDSRNAINAVGHASRVTSHTDRRPDWIPDLIWRRVYIAVRRLGPLDWTLLGGHPTRADLARGRRLDGKAVSRHNVWCDGECKRRAAEILAAERSQLAGATA